MQVHYAPQFHEFHKNSKGGAIVVIVDTWVERDAQLFRKFLHKKPSSAKILNYFTFLREARLQFIRVTLHLLFKAAEIIFHRLEKSISSKKWQDYERNRH